MIATVAQGWEAYQAKVFTTPPARLIAGSGASWTRTSYAAYEGLDDFAGGTTDALLADSTRTILAMIYWLTGKRSGASVLICAPIVPDVATWGQAFRDVLTGAGHNLTFTDSRGGWSGFEPLDYDLLALDGSVSTAGWSYHGIADGPGRLDYVLANGGHVLVSYASNVARYGFSVSSQHPQWGSAPLTHLTFGAGGPANWRNQTVQLYPARIAAGRWFVGYNLSRYHWLRDLDGGHQGRN
jgi:hypothetical protein